MLISAGIALYDSKYTYELYEKVKKDFPDWVKNDPEYQYIEGETTHFMLEKDSESYNYVLQKAEEYNIPIYNNYELTIHSKEEIKNAEYFLLLYGCPLEAEGTSAEDYGTRYTNCCEKCKIGGIPLGDALVDRRFVKKVQFATLKRVIIVSEQVKWLIESNGLTGVHFGRVKDYKGREMQDCYSLLVDNILPPMDKKTWLTINPPAETCDQCGIIVPYLNSHCYYHESDFNNACDFNLTYEFMNNWAERGIIASKRVKEIFSKYRVRVGYEMLNIVEKM